MSKEFSYSINKDATATIHVNAKKLTTRSLVTLITQIQAIYRELENYQQLPRPQVRSKRTDGSAVKPRTTKPRAPQVRSKHKGTRKMPKGTKVEKIYQAVRSSGKDAGSAARIAQAASGQSLKTGKKPKKK